MRTWGVCGGARRDLRAGLRPHVSLPWALLATAVAVLAACSSALAAPDAAPYRVQRVCGTPRPLAAACTGMKLVPASLTDVQLHASAVTQAAQAARGASPAVTNTSPIPGFLTAQNLHDAYSLPTETASSTLQTIAVVDAFDDPTAEADLGVYDQQFGLPACTAANGCFAKINEEGHASPLPAKQGEWASEISIDVQMAHAICQTCRILLVEAKTEEFSDLGTAVNAAVAAGATEISNSYAGPEEPVLASIFSELDSLYYNHPGVVLTVASGDCGYLDEACFAKAADFPADSPTVVAVGGTKLTEKKEKWSSTVWEEGGSGCSQIFTAPLWQSAVANFAATGCGSWRSIADVAAIGDPNTGVDVYDSTPEGHGAPTGWGVWGGTSVASPIVAAEYALAGGSQNVSYPAATLYSHIGEGSALFDVVSGSNGSCGKATSCQAAVGFDGPTGVGSPLGLEAFSIPGAPASTSRPTISGVTEQGQTLTEAPGEWTDSPTSIAEQWEACNASGSGCEAITGATGLTHVLSAGDVGSTIRVQETAANAAGSGPPAASTATAVVASTVPAITGFTPGSGITGSEVTIEGTALGAVTKVQFGSLTASFHVISPTQIEATVPDGAVASALSVSGPQGGATSKAQFTPTLSVTAFKPKVRAPGKVVTISGVGFNASSTVSFAGHPATVRSRSSKKLKVVVPAAAPAGPIAVTNSSAPIGTVLSASSFTP
jgi:IPT/TIG domain